MNHPLPPECHEGHLSGMHASRPRQHLSGIHPPGGRVAPSAPVVWPIAKPGGIGRPPPDDRVPDETDMVTHTYQPDAA